MEEELEHEKT